MRQVVISTAAWTDDASSGIVAGRTIWAHHFGATTTATVNGVSVTGLAGPNASNANFDLTGMTSVFNGDTNNVTTGGSDTIANDFVFGGNPASILLKNLTIGRSYTLTLLSAGCQGDADATVRTLTLSSGGDSQTFQQSQFGNGNGIRISYTFVATTATRTVNVGVANPNNATFYLYGLALSSLVVTSTTDASPGSLRQALADAALNPGPDTITFASALSGQTITLSTEIVINDTTAPVTIDGSGLAGGVTIAGNSLNRLFTVTAGTVVTLNSLTLTQGGGGGAALGGNGGAILNQGGTLNLTNCALVQNQGFSFSGGTHGGAIYNEFGTGTLTLSNCTLSGNTASSGGAISNFGTAVLTHCSLSLNTASTNDGGGIYNFGNLTLNNSIVSGNTAPTGPDIRKVAGTITPIGANFIGKNDTVSTEFPAGPLVGTTASPKLAQLAALGSYGGLTQTMPPLAGSPAIDAAIGSTATTDQRGFTRPADGDGDGSAVADLGAVERLAPSAFIVTTTADSGAGSLRQAIANARFQPGADTITFAPALSGQTITLSGTQAGGNLALTDTDGITIDATSLPGGLTISGAATASNGTDPSGHRIFNLGTGVSLTLKCLTLSGGTGFSSNQNGSGGAIYAPGSTTLTLDRCTLSDNTASNVSNGGGAIRCAGTLFMTRCTLSGNTSTGTSGGAIFLNNGANATLTHCTIANNTALTAGGGIARGSGTLTLNYCIVANNTAPSNTNISGTFTGSANITSGDPVLSSLADNGGPTKTMLPLPGSPAIDAATGSTATSDQRGAPSPMDGDNNGTTVADIGAVERLASSAFIVTTTADSGAGSLRQAIGNAPFQPGPDTITFAPALSGQTIAPSSEIVISPASAVTLDATSLTNGLTISGSNSHRIFIVNGGATLDLRGLTLSGGNADSGGAIANYYGTLTLTQCTLSGNHADYGLARGGAIYNDIGGRLTLTQCTLSGNHADFGGGGGAIANYDGDFFKLTNSIVAGNTRNGVEDNIYSTGTTSIGVNLTSGNPFLAPLGNYGGPTQTMPPLLGSPAIDAGSATAIASAGLTTDQRGAGFPRVLDGDGDNNATVDIGAVELRRAVVTTVADELDPQSSDGTGISLREALRDGADLIVFGSALNGQTITLDPLKSVQVDPGNPLPDTTRTGMILDKSLEINAESLAAGITVKGNADGNAATTHFRLFFVPAGKTVAMRNVTLTNGGASISGTNYADFGGAISIDGTLSLTRCTLSGNSVPTGQSGGAIEATSGSTLTMADCTLSGNSADYGGAITADNATVTLDRCTLSGNIARNGQGGGFSGQAGSVSFQQCTIASNTATGLSANNGYGGGIFSQNVALVLNQCTIASNTANGFGGTAHGGGVFVEGGYGIANTIIAGNTAATSGADLTESNFNPSLFSFTGRVFIGSFSGNGFTADANVLTGNALLDVLADYGGPTLTMRPQIGSPVIDQADGTAHFGTALDTSFSTDQRGFTRPQDGDGNGSALSDLGAVERVPGSHFFTVTNNANSGTGTLRTALVDAKRSDGADTIVFDPALNGLTVTLSGSQAGGNLTLTDTDGITIDATSLPGGLTISGAANGTDPSGHRIFNLSGTGVSLTLKCLTLSGGTGFSANQSGSGGAIYAPGGSTITLDRCTLSGNTASNVSNGGGAIRCAGTLVMTRCTLSGNTSTGTAGGAIFLNNGATGTLTHCTIANNTALTAGGGITEGNGPFTLNYCIVANNTASASPNFNGTFTGSGNLTTGDPLLAPLGSYGGPTKTIALLTGSPARNAATGSTAFTSDQRGFPIVGTPDIGAYEAGQPGSFYASAAENGTTANPNADADHDGSSDLMEYATRGNTNLYNGNPVGQPVSIVLSGNVPAKTFVFFYRSDSRDLRYTVQRSGDLNSWTPIYTLDMRTPSPTITRASGVTSQETPNPGFVTLTDINFIPAKTFYRLVVELP